MNPDSNELGVNDIVVVIGCEVCDCPSHGSIFEIRRTHDNGYYLYSNFCRKAESSSCLERVVTDIYSSRWYPISWLRTYPHFKEWHGK